MVDFSTIFPLKISVLHLMRQYLNTPLYYHTDKRIKDDRLSWNISLTRIKQYPSSETHENTKGESVLFEIIKELIIHYNYQLI